MINKRRKTVRYSKLRGMFASHGMNYEQVGKVLGLSKTAIGLRMAGKTEWKLSELQILRKYYGVSYDEIID